MSASEENRSNLIVTARLSHSQGSLCILRPKQYHAFKTFNPKSNQQAKRNQFPIFTAVLRQPRETLSSYRTFLLSTSCHRYRSCQLAKRTDPILSSQLDSVTAKGVYACFRPKQYHAFKTFNPKSNQQAKRNQFPIFTAALRQPRETLSSYRTFLLSTSCHRYRSCQLAKRTDPILSSQLDSVTAKGVYASSDQSNIMRSRRSIQSPISKRRETNFQSSLLRSDSQGKHCHPIGLSFFQHHVTDIGLVS